MRKRSKIWKVLALVMAGLALLLLGMFIYLVSVATVLPPKPTITGSLALERTEIGPGFYTVKNNWFRKSSSGLYELYVEGDPFEMGVVNGKLTKELVQRQEDHFNNQIRKMIPSGFYLHFLKYFIGWFNRHLDGNVTEEYREEIYGVSEAASADYAYIGSNYQRILNYHAAHDIGHALQSMALVGCTSFGTWNDRSEDSTMIIGRNFDFYVGDKFAEEKIVAFYNPSKGHKFMTVTWGGFIGVVSGMNDQGLTVTINAAKTNIPTASATPVSLVAREVLQYAKNISEAVAIARKRKMFVAESFLVASAQDNKAVVIEKTPEDLDIYDPGQNFITCANHFQGKKLGNSELNQVQIKESASMYRSQRLDELMSSMGKNTVEKTVGILRDRGGLHDANIGLGNEKSINQLIAHHSIVFEPQKRLVWVSTAPWQLGKYVAYDLNTVFALKGMKENREVSDSGLYVPPDPFLLSEEFKNFETFRGMKQRLLNGGSVDADSLVRSNPAYYHAYVLAGDQFYKNGQFQKALDYYKTALTKVIATKKEEDYIREQLKNCTNKPDEP